MSFALIQGKKAETNFMKTEGSPESAGLYSDLINKELTLIPFGALTLIIEMLKLYSSDMAAFSTALITIMSIILYFTTNWSWFVFAWSSTFISTVFVPLIYLLST